MKNGSQTKIDVAVLQEQIERLDINVTRILENHLPHIQAEIEAIRLKIAYWTGASAVLGVIVQILLKYIK